ncbi:DUF4141 domain-containing protein [Flavobacterium sp. WW92]|uniref:DUF4141 domain-containing protein n=1 Tax=unclassified Flavobacterium TaxID=196869 RepID=UPI0022248FC6|nr:MULTISPECIES: DUF4141 domain-containing protein [unclassified Flavobacterium]WDO12309.1 DUF4141 domain-containing protein [Flavobacterium sp. WW92]
MKNLILTIGAWACVALAPTRAQWVVSDPTNLAQGIVNTAQEIVHTSATASSMLDNFKEVQKVYNQGKEYYDALKAVNNLVKDARKVQETVLMVGDISELYVSNFGKMLNDPNFSATELSAIGNGYARLLNESTGLLNDLRQIVNASSLSLNDKERMDVIDRVHGQVKNYYNLVRYYTNKNISVSFIRAKKKNDTRRVLELYGTPDQKYW